MKPKGRIAWLVTWEGKEFNENECCKIAAVLSPSYTLTGLKPILHTLFVSESEFALDEKVEWGFGGYAKHLFKEDYIHINPQYIYGYYGKRYLCCRKVKNLRWIENPENTFKATLFWTENPKYILTPDAEFAADVRDALKTVSGERECQYTWELKRKLSKQ